MRYTGCTTSYRELFVQDPTGHVRCAYGELPPASCCLRNGADTMSSNNSTGSVLSYAEHDGAPELGRQPPGPLCQRQAHIGCKDTVLVGQKPRAHVDGYVDEVDLGAFGDTSNVTDTFLSVD